MLNDCKNNRLESPEGLYRSKAASDIEPVSVNFVAWLASLPVDPTATAAESLSSIIWSADAGVTITGQSMTSPVAYAQLNGGTVGAMSTIKLTVTTNTGVTGSFSYLCEIT